MEDGWQELAIVGLTVGLSSIRIAVAFLMMPLFTNEIMPALVRNSIFVSLGIIVAVVHPIDALLTSSLGYLLVVICKEIFLGLSIGLLLGVFLWAFEAAGELVDTQVGTAQAQLFDPISGHTTTLYGDFLGRLANIIFLAAGGLSLLVGLILRSFAVWPIETLTPRLERDGLILFSEAFGGVFTLLVLLAAPLIAVLFMIDISMGMVNRFAQRLNVFFLSNSLKSLVAPGLFILLLPALIETLLKTLDSNAGEVLDMIPLLFQQ